MRPVLYGSYHEVQVISDRGGEEQSEMKKVNVVGNICESGDIIAKERELPHIEEGDFIAVMTPELTATRWRQTTTAACAPPRC